MSENAGSWISVKERMPKDGERVLVCLTEGPLHPPSPFYVIARKTREVEALAWYRADGSVGMVTSDEPRAWWMPLPDAPEEGGRDE